MQMKKKNDKKLMERVQLILRKKGQKAFEIAENAILEEKIIREPVHEALRYFMQESWYDVHHPALLSLACEAVGGNPKTTTHIGAAIVLLAGAADLHDDIIDRSEIKDSRPTVFGKFGENIALLAGDALLFKGLILLHNACKELPKGQGRRTINLTKKAFFEIGNAEAKELSFRGKYDLELRKYYDVIETKATVAEICARIGAILGGGNSKEINALGRYGKTLGILMTIRDDFIDLFEPDELRNRARNEVLPLPILYAFLNLEKKSEIIRLLRKDEITEKETREILDLVMDTREVQNLKKEMQSLKTKTENLLRHFKMDKRAFKLLLRCTMEDL